MRAPHVLQVAPRGSRAALKGQGVKGIDVLVDDIDRGLDEAVATGRIDGSRICAYGHSNAATVLAYYITRRTGLRCAIIHSPALFDWAKDYFEIPDSSFVESMMGGATPFSDRPAYDAMSVEHGIPAIHTPVLIIAGGREPTFALRAKTMFSEMRSARKQVDLIIYPEENHVLSMAALSDFWSRALQFFSANMPEP
jgi:dipeptidyl aminopeptidase/acylaminoacyl peptidase